MRQTGLRYAFGAALLLLCHCGVQGQTVVWQMPLEDYNTMTRVGSNLYEVSRHGKIGLVSGDGAVVAPIENDQISDFYEHKALVMRTDAQGERVMGCLTDEGEYYAFARKYYTLTGQKFYSDNLLSVADENGKIGYIDLHGNEVVGFDGKYSRIKPFTEGYAAVMRNKKYVLIDRNGTEVKFVYGGNGVGAAIAGCTNVYHGISYVYDEYGGSDRSYFIYDTRTRNPLKKVSRIKNTATDYLYCYQSISGRSKEVPFEKRKPYSGVAGLAPHQEGNLYGYGEGVQTVLPCQLTDAQPFADGTAVVGMGGKRGVLRYVDGDSFSATMSGGHFDFTAGSSVTCRFSLHVPTAWKGKQLEVVVKDADGAPMAAKGSAGNYTFTVRPSGSGSSSYEVQVMAEGLTLYKGDLACSFTKKEPVVKKPTTGTGTGTQTAEKRCPDCGKKLSECEYGGVHYKKK